MGAVRGFSQAGTSNSAVWSALVEGTQEDVAEWISAELRSAAGFCSPVSLTKGALGEQCNRF